MGRNPDGLPRLCEMRHFNVVVQVALPRTARVEASQFDHVAGYFVNVGAWAEAPEQAERLAREIALRPDAQSSWVPPEGSTVAGCEVEETSVGEEPPTSARVAFVSGRAFYPRKRWWQFWQ